MDPMACYMRWLSAETRAERREAAADYNGWIARGGFPAAVPFSGGRHAVVEKLSERMARGYVRREDGTIGLPFRLHRRHAPGMLPPAPVAT